MPFSSTEIETALAKFVRTSIRREYGALGNRRTDLTFSDLQDAAAGVFITKQKAPEYVVRLGVDKLAEYLQTVLSQVEEVQGLIEGTGRNVTPVENLSPLAGARSAVAQLASATSSRTSSFARVEDIPAFQRFDASVQRFLDESSKNIRSDGDVVRTPDEARKLLGSSVTALKEAYVEVIRRAGLLAAAREDYESMNLPQTLSQQVMANARDVLGDRYDELSAMTPKARLESLREVTLDVLTARATVKGFGSLNPSTLFYLIDGAASVFADATHPAIPASLLSTYYGPYPITETQYELHFTVEGDDVTIPIQGSFISRIDCVIAGPYEIDALNNNLRIQLDNYPTVGNTSSFDVSFTLGATQQVWEVVADINAALSPAVYPIISEPYLNPQKWSGAVDITEPGTTYDVELDSTNPSLDFLDLDGAGLAIVVGDRVIVRDGSSSYDEHIVEVMAVSSTKIEGDFLYPAVPATGSETGKEVEVGEALMVRLRITKEANDNGFTGAVDYQYEALRDRVAILIPKVGASTEQEQYDAATTIGLFPLMESRSAPTSAKTVADSMNKSILNNTWAAGVSTPRVEVTAELDPYAYEGPARTNPNDFLQVICAKFNAVGDVSSGISPVTFTVEGAESAGVEVGDVVVLRTTIHTGEANTYGLITLVDDTQIQATMVTAVTADTNVTIEAGPNLYLLEFDATVVLTGDTGNEGEYLVTAVGEIPFELTINSALPFPNAAGNAPVWFTAAVGHYKVRFASVDETLDTYITVDAAGASAFLRFFEDGLYEAAGLTPYVLLPEWPAGLEEEDQFEQYTLDTVDPTFYSLIVSLEQSSLLIELADPLSTALPDLDMTVNSQLPFGRIRKMSLETYNSLKDSLDGWVNANNSDLFFRNFQALINPLVSNKNPTPAQVNAATTSLEGLYTSLGVLGVYLGDYQADVVEDVDTLIKSFQEKGADRAVDVLLEGRFSDFFGLDQDEVSYAGTMQKAIRGVQREDLPVRKNNRLSYQGSDGLLAEYDDKDFEFARDDIDNDVDIDLPGG